MASSHASQVRRNWAAEYHRKVNPALQRLRKVPERVCGIHRATMPCSGRQGQPRLMPSPAANGQPTLGPAATHMVWAPTDEDQRLQQLAEKQLQIVIALAAQLAAQSSTSLNPQCHRPEVS